MNDFLDRNHRDLTIGIDLGGTNLRAALFEGLQSSAARAAEDGSADLEPHEPLALLREEIGEPRDPDSVVGKIMDVVRRLRGEAGVGKSIAVPIGIGIAAMLRGRDGEVANSPALRWRNVPFGALLRQNLGQPVGVFNDVNAITFGEYAMGAGAGATDVLGVFVGTGIGGGAVAGGQLLEGFNNTALEIGHVKVVFDATARQCGCGLRGCIEAYVGGDNMQRRARLELSQGIRSAAVRLAGKAEFVNPGHLDAAAAEGDAYSLELFAEVAPLLGVVLANAVTLLNPERLVLGGGVLSRTPVLREHVIAAFHVAVNPPAREGLEIVDSRLGDAAGLIGSALLAAR